MLAFTCECDKKLMHVVSMSEPNPAYTIGTPGSVWEVQWFSPRSKLGNFFKTVIFQNNYLQFKPGTAYGIHNYNLRAPDVNRKIGIWPSNTGKLTVLIVQDDWLQITSKHRSDTIKEKFIHQLNYTGCLVSLRQEKSGTQMVRREDTYIPFTLGASTSPTGKKVPKSFLSPFIFKGAMGKLKGPSLSLSTCRAEKLQSVWYMVIPPYLKGSLTLIVFLITSFPPRS